LTTLTSEEYLFRVAEKGLGEATASATRLSQLQAPATPFLEIIDRTLGPSAILTQCPDPYRPKRGFIFKKNVLVFRQVGTVNPNQRLAVEKIPDPISRDREVGFCFFWVEELRMPSFIPISPQPTT